MTHQPSPPPPGRPRWIKRLAIGLVIAVTSLVLAEVIIRVINPTPPVQVVRENFLINMKKIDGTVVWVEKTLGDLYQLDCGVGAGGDRSAVFVGDSIFYSVAEGRQLTEQELERGLNFTTLLQRALDQTPGQQPSCIHNLSSPGFGFQQKFALLRHHAEELRPKVVFWGIWHNELLDYALIDDSLYRLRELERGPDGVPNIFGLPMWLNAPLFSQSRLYNFLTLKYATRQGNRLVLWRAYAEGRLATLKQYVDSLGARLVLVFGAPLDAPFADSVRDFPTGFQAVREGAQRQGIETMELAQILIDHDYLDLRGDSCCHYNIVGHERLAEAFLPVVRRLLQPP